MAVSDALGVHLLPTTARWERKTPDLFTGATFPFTQAWGPALDFATAGRVSFVSNGLAADLSVEIDGLVSAIPVNETLVITSAGSGIARSAKTYDQLTQIRVAATQAGSLTATMKTIGGEPLHTVQVLATALPIRIRSSRQSLPTGETQGRQELSRWVAYVQEADIRFGDIITVDSVAYEVEHALPTYGYSRVHHTELRLRKLD